MARKRKKEQKKKENQKQGREKQQGREKKKKGRRQTSRKAGEAGEEAAENPRLHP